MQLNLKLFEQQVDPTILERGLKYYNADRVDEIERSANGREIDFAVIGTEPYHVHLSIEGDVVKEYSCDCPYDFGPVCKHVVAALFELENSVFTDYEEVAPKINHKARSTTKIPKKKQGRKNITSTDINKILESLSIEELRDFIRKESTDRMVKMRLVNMYGDRVLAPSSEMYRTQIRSIIREAAGRYGYVEYRDARTVGKEIEEILDSAMVNIDTGLVEQGWAKIEAVIEEAETIINCGDDSSGYLGGAVSTAFYQLAKIEPDTLPKQFRSDLFDYMMSKYEADYLSGFDWNADLLDIALKMIDESDDDQYRRIEKALTIGKYNTTSWRERHKLQIMAGLIAKRYSQTEAEKFIYNNRANPDFRKQLIQKAIENEDYDVALQLVEEGLQNEGEYCEYKNEWNRYKLDIYIRRKDRKKIAAIAKYHFLDGYHRDYTTSQLYQLIKENTPAEDWNKQCKSLITQLKQQPSWSSQERLLHIYVCEKMWDDYFVHLKNYPTLSNLKEAEQYFKEEYRDEFVTIYADAIRTYADGNLGRDAYIELTRYLRRLKKFGEGELAMCIADELRTKYPKRRAMIEELNKI